MPILLRYILREHLKILSLCLGILVLVYLAIDFFEQIGRLVEREGSIPVIFQYFAFRIPRIVFDVTPIAVLLAALITLGVLSRYHEIIAMRSSGVSLLFVTSPILGSALILSLLLGIGNLSLIPLTKQKAEYIRSVKIKKNTEESYFGQSHLWLRDGRRTFANILFVDSVHRRLNDVTLYRLREDFTLQEYIQAKRIQHENGVWMMYEGRIRIFSEDGSMTERFFEREPVALERKPEEFKGLDVNTDRMKFAELNRYIDRLAKDGYDADRFRVDLYNKISFPMVSFIMSLIAIPFGLMQTRSRGISRGIGISLLIGSSYWIIHSFALSLGHAGLLPPLLASSLANLIFLAIGAYLYLRIRQ